MSPIRTATPPACGSRRPAVLEPLRRPFDAAPSNARTLADDLIDAALPPGSDELDADGLLAALTLIAGIEPGVDKTVERRAKALQPSDPGLAGGRLGSGRGPKPIAAG